MSEAYVNASASPEELRAVATTTTGIAIAYAAAAVVGVRAFGTHGLVAANVLNMALRTSVSYAVIVLVS